MKNFWNKLLVFLKIKKPEIEESDEDHALDMIINSMISELPEEVIEEIMKAKD